MQTKVMSDSPGLVDFAIGLEYSVLNLSEKQEDFFFGNLIIINIITIFWGAGREGGC